MDPVAVILWRFALTSNEVQSQSKLWTPSLGSNSDAIINETPKVPKTLLLGQFNCEERCSTNLSPPKRDGNVPEILQFRPKCNSNFYTSDSDPEVIQQLLMQAGDVEINPGPSGNILNPLEKGRFQVCPSHCTNLL